MRNTLATIDGLEPRTAQLVARRQQVLGPSYRLFYEKPIELVKANGVYLYDRDGTEYLDAYNNVPCVGHCHPHVTAAVAQQVQVLNTNTRYLAEPIVGYAERLLATHSSALGHVMFTCTGSEAIDLALRISRYFTGGSGLVVTANAYHGITTAAAEISPSLGPRVPLGTHVRTVALPEATGDDVRAVGTAFASTVAAAIADLERHGIPFCAFVADSVFSSDGLRPDPPGFLQPVVDVVRRAGGLYVADEVQAGFGRTGGVMWGYQRHDVVPDIVAMGKPMGNGMPIAGIATRPELLEKFGADVRYFNTFGGNSVCIAAAAAVLEVLEEEHLVEHARAIGGHLRDSLTAMTAGHPSVKEVRGAGLYLAVEVVRPDTKEPDARAAARLVNGLRARRVLISATGPSANVLKVRPPLPFSQADADRFIGAFGDALAELEV
jgi:4-aminobutyrate aminotransferase-like enzyme